MDLQDLIPLPPGVQLVRDEQGRPVRLPPPPAVPADPDRQAAAELERLRRMVPPSIAQTLTDGSLQRTTELDAVLDWARARVRRGLVIRGGVGTGKSLAAGLLVQRGPWGGQVSWHRPDGFVSAMLHSYADDAPKLGKTLVVVDDLGRERKTDVDEALCAFIDDTDTAFVLTTNLTREAFRERYDARLIDRLNHCAIAVTFKGATRRRQDGGF